MGVGTAIIRPGGITSLITDTGVPIIGPTGGIITGRTIIQTPDIITQGATTGGIAYTSGIAYAATIGVTDMPGAIIGIIAAITAITGATGRRRHFGRLL